MRRRYVTHPKFQYSFTLSFSAGVIVSFLLIGGSAIGTLLLLSVDTGFSPEQKKLLIEGAKSMVAFVFFVGIPFFIGLTAIGFYLSYKFVGPLSRVETWMEALLLGQSIPFLKLRPGDELAPIVKVVARIMNNYFTKKRRE